MKCWKDCKPGDSVWVLDYEHNKSLKCAIEYLDESKFGTGYLSLTLSGYGNPLQVCGQAASRCINENMVVYCDWDAFEGDVNILLDDLKSAYESVSKFNELK